MKRPADGNKAVRKSSKHSADDRSTKRQRNADGVKTGTKKSDKKENHGREESRIKIHAPKEEERAFPRGGASVLTPLEFRQVNIQASRDVLFEETGQKRPAEVADGEDIVAGGAAKSETATRRKRRKTTHKEPNGSKDEARIRVESLNYKTLVPGSLVLGQVTQINPRNVILALPNNLTGSIPLTAVSAQLTQRLERVAAKVDNANSDDDVHDSDSNADSEFDDIQLNKVFTVGQYLRAYVTSTTDHDATSKKGTVRKRIELSVEPRLANSGLTQADLVMNSMIQASVKSIEDHGLVMDIGFGDDSIKGFMSSREIGQELDHTKIEEGSVFLCLITGLSSNGKIVKLSADRRKAASFNKSSFVTDAPTINALLPGTAVEVLISNIYKSGIVGKVMGMLDVTADFIHSALGKTNKRGSEMYEVGSKVKARVLCTFPASERLKVGITLLKHVLSFDSYPSKDGKDPLELLPLSSFVEEAKVNKVEPAIGLFMDVGIPGLPGFAHISRLADGKSDSLSESTGKYKLRSAHRARVIGYSPLDGLYQLSLEQSMLDQPFLRVEDVTVGEVVKGTIENLSVDETGVWKALVRLADSIYGYVPGLHLADIHLEHPERKYRVGQKVTARVLSVSPTKKKVLLTLKKTLVNSEASVWSNYDQIKPGLQAPGTLVKIMPSGAIVHFYADVRAFLPKSEMSEAHVDDPTHHFRLGQVVTVYALSVDPEERKLRVSCREQSALDTAHYAAMEKITVGEVIDGNVTETTNESITVTHTGTGLTGVIKLDHLSDGSRQKNLSLMKQIRVGSTMRELVVLEKKRERPLLALTSKPSLVRAARSGTLISSIDGLNAGQKVDGFVRNITPHEIFVQFANGVTGLLPKEKVRPEMKELPDFGLRLDQSVSAVVLSVDQHSQRFWLSMVEKTEPASTETAGPEQTTNAGDHEPDSTDALTLGKKTMARITAVKESQLNVQIADNIQGRVDVSEVFDKWEDIKDRKHPLKIFKTKQVIPVTVLGIHDARNHRFLPISHRSGKNIVFELSAKSKTNLDSESDIVTLDKIEVGSSWIAFVNNYGDCCVWVNLTPNIRGRIELRDLSNNISHLADLEQNFPIGSAIQVRVKKVDVASNRLDLAAASVFSSHPLSWESLSKGSIVAGRVTKVTDHSVIVQLSGTVSGPVGLTELVDDYSQLDISSYKKNDIVRVCVLDVDASKKRISLSMRPSKVLSSSLPVKDPQILSVSQLKANDIIRGFVKHVVEKGLFVRLGPTVTAHVRLSDLSDNFLKDWKAEFPVNKLVTGKVLAADPSEKYVQMSLKTSVIDSNYVPPITFGDVKPGQVVSGKVRKVEDFGVFIVIDNSSNVSGLCHRSQIADGPVEHVKKLYEEGDKVKAFIVKVDPEKRRISFSLKASHFSRSSEAEEDDIGDGDPDDGVDLQDLHIQDHQEDEREDIELADLRSIDAQSDHGSSQVEEEADAKGSAEEIDGLNVGGFDWTGAIAEDDAADSESETDQLDAPKKKKRKRPEIKVDMTGDLDKYGPQSVADFERLLLSQPNASSLWIQYMAFQLQLNEVDKARAIAERALKTIHIREEEEKMNVWIALLNLENAYGTDDSIEDVFKRACQYNDQQEIHERLASIYIDSGKHEKADELFQAMTKIKSITPDPNFWLNYATFLMTTLSDSVRARSLLPRATQSVPPYLHRYLTTKFGALEFQSPNGDPERGRTIFEGLISTFPKRWDLWDMFVDLENSKGEKENVRALYERMSVTKMKSKRARVVFKRWLAFEQANGDQKAAERVKAKAAEYVARVKAGAETGE